MFERLKKFLQGEPPPIAERVDDPVLGTLTWNEDGEVWCSDAIHEGIGFEFRISGTPEPFKSLLAHAEDIFHRKNDFVAAVLAHVKSEGDMHWTLRPYREEIAGLRIDAILLCWPDRPEDGLITFGGGREYRAWRCGYVSGNPHGLCFDS